MTTILEWKSNTPTLPRHVPISSNPTADFELIFNLILTQVDCRGRDHHSIPSINLRGFFVFLGLLATRVTKPCMKIVTAHLHKFLLQVFLPSVHSAWSNCNNLEVGRGGTRERDHKWIGRMRYLTADTVPSLVNSLGQTDCINVFISSGASGSSSIRGNTHTPLLGVSNILEEIDRVIAISDQYTIPVEEDGGGKVD